MKLSFSPSGRTVDLPDQAVRLAEAFRSNMMDASELLHLAGALALYPWDEQAIVVEIGAFTGQTTVFMAKTLQLLGRRVPILSIDPFERAARDATNVRGSYSAYLKNIRKHKVDDQCLPLVAFSEQAAPAVSERIGLLVIDGSHRYVDICKDLILYMPKLRPGGILFLDDFVPAYPDVMRALNEYLAGNSALEILHKTYFVVAQRT